VKYWHDKFRADYILSLADIFTMADVLEPKSYMDGTGEGMKVISWVPIDHVGVAKAIWKPLEKAYSVIVMSKFGKEELRQRGIESTYIPHSIDTSIFRPLEDKGKCKEELSFNRDDFVVGIVGANKGSRKHIAEQIMAFAKFAKRHIDAKLYLHMNVTQDGGGYDIRLLIEDLGIEDRTFVTHPNDLLTGLSPETMNKVYNGFDVLMHCSKGEGFGIALIEAQSAGIPVLATRFSSMTELVCEDGLLDSSSYDVIVHGGYRANVNPDDMTDKLEKIYQRRKSLYLGVGSRFFRDRVLQFDNNQVWKDYWLPFFKNLGFAGSHVVSQNKEKILAIA
jgi:glycosyltransferase involved in cell wall biosynthesis